MGSRAIVMSRLGDTTDRDYVYPGRVDLTDFTFPHFSTMICGFLPPLPQLIPHQQLISRINEKKVHNYCGQ